jgi:glycosyltransferase involved in cell wall biosynthesis
MTEFRDFCALSVPSARKEPTESPMTPGTPSVLHLLAQRPTLTGSGVTLDQLARHAGEAGWEQYAVVGLPMEDDSGVVGVPAAHLFPLRFESMPLPFPVVGMSDVMPYASTRYSSLDNEGWRRLRMAWFEHLRSVAQRIAPSVIHTHHLWLMSSLVKETFPGVPVVAHCHATGLRQMELCPERVPEIIAGLRRNEEVVVLDAATVPVVADRLQIDRERIHVVGAGYRQDLFHPMGRSATPGRDLLYVGKLARAKGFDSLLDAFERISADDPEIRLHVAGGGAGDEADAFRERMQGLGTRVTFHGQLAQKRLAELMRACDVLALPSFYEGLPLVLCEAAACGCRVVATDLPGVRDPLAGVLGGALRIVSLPAMVGVDEPDPAALPAFTANLAAALSATLDAGPGRTPNLDDFTWSGVFERVQAIWRRLAGA